MMQHDVGQGLLFGADGLRIQIGPGHEGVAEGERLLLLERAPRGFACEQRRLVLTGSALAGKLIAKRSI